MTPRRFIAKVFRRLAYATDRSLFEPTVTPAPPVAAVTAPDPAAFDPYSVPQRDNELCGWFNRAEHELYPGFALSAADRVADIGCGFGNHARFCADMGAEVMLVEANEMKLDRARARWAPDDPRISTHLSGSLPLPIDDARCTRVICNEVLEHVEDTAAFLAELVRIGKPGARYLISVPAPLGEHVMEQVAHPSYFQPPNHIRIIEPDEFRAMVEAAGLKVETLTSYGAYWAVWWWLFWCDPQPNGNPRHPVLDHWAQTWHALLESSNGLQIKRAMDRLLPKSQIIIAVKP